MGCQTCDPRRSSLDDYLNERRMNGEIWQQRVQIEQQRKQLDEGRAQRKEERELNALHDADDD
jgi:hypothetical protein